jgi:hypothetical protein
VRAACVALLIGIVLVLQRKILTIASILGSVVLASVLFLYFAFGGFEKFNPPINVVIPKGYEGIACGQWFAGESLAETTWTLDSRGYFKVSGEIQSHRPRIFHYRDVSTGALSPAPDGVWNPIYTENDPKVGSTFSVVWVGAIDGWNHKVAANDTSRVCLGRFK